EAAAVEDEVGRIGGRDAERARDPTVGDGVDLEDAAGGAGETGLVGTEGQDAVPVAGRVAEDDPSAVVVDEDVAGAGDRTPDRERLRPSGGEIRLTRDGD